MTGTIFKENKKKILISVFAVVFFALGFWLAQPAPKAEAACGGECYSDAGVCKTDETGTILTGTPYKLCTINTPSGYSGAAWGTTSCYSGSGAAQVHCRQDACPSTANPALNGRPCDILVGTSSLGVCNNPIVDIAAGGANGLWDESENQCIQCLGLKENGVCGDITLIKSITDGVCNGSGTGYNKFETACSVGVSTQCDEQSTGCVGTAGFCNSSGVYTACPSNNCSGGACPGVTLLSVTANPNTITKDTPSNITFTVTNASGNVSGAAVAISGAGISASCSSNTGSDGKCTASVTATSTGTATATASKTGSTSGTTTITVNPAAACVFGGATFMIGFQGSSYNVGDTPKVNFTIPGGHDGCTELYKPDGTSSDWSRSDGPGSYFNTITTSTGVAGTWKVTISDGFGGCSSGSTCFATTTVTAATVCTAPACNPANSNQYCSSSLWVTCPSGQTCLGGSCITSPPPCIPIGAGCSQPADCCSGNCSGGTCAVVAPPCVPTAPVENCATPGDEDCNGLADAVDPACAVVPPSAGPCGSGSGTYRSPLSYCSIQELIQGATGWVLGLVSSIIILFLVYGGIMYATAAGDETRMESAKNIIYYAIVGLAIVLISYTLITEVKTILKVK